MKNVRTLLEIVEQWVTQIEDIMIGSNKTQYNQQNQEPEFSVDLSRNRERINWKKRYNRFSPKRKK